MNKGGWTKEALKAEQKQKENIDSMAGCIVITIRIICIITIAVCVYIWVCRIQEHGLKHYFDNVWEGNKKEIQK